MLIAISKIKVRSGHLGKVMPLLRDNAHLGTSQKGCLESYLARNVDNNDEILIYTLWQSQQDYEEALEKVKKDPRFTKAALQLLPHLAHEPQIHSYTVVPMN